MEKSKSLIISLSQEELFVILMYLQWPGIVGLDKSIFDKQKEEDRNIIAGVAERSLIARGFLAQKGKEFRTSQPVYALIGACLDSDSMILMNWDRAGQPKEGIYFHVAQKMRVIHSIPIPGIHQFIAVVGNKDLLHAAVSHFRLEKPNNVPAFGGELPEEIIQKARKIAAEEKSVNSIIPILLQSGFSEQASKDFGEALANPTSAITVTRLVFTDKSEKQNDAFTLLSGANSLWMLKRLPLDQNKEKWVAIKPVSVEQAEQDLITLFKGLPEVMN